jgi:hypothetical protein
MLVGTRVPRELTWKPPTREERMRVWWRSVAGSPGSFIRPTFSAVPMHMSNRPEDFGQGLGGFGKRYANTFLTFTLQDTAGHALSAAARYEVRYIQCKCTGFLPRVGHALLFNIVTYDKDGKKVFNWPSIGGAYAVGMLSTMYTPNQKWSAQGIQAGHNAFVFGFGSALVQEFMPNKLFSRKKQKLPPPPPPVVAPQPSSPGSSSIQ